MLESVLSLERDLFLAINNFHTSFLDITMMMYTGIIAWIPYIIFFIVMLTYRKTVKEWLPVLLALIAVVLVGYMVSGLFFKPFFERFRPTFHPDFMDIVKTVKDYAGEGIYGFISGHSTFSFGIAMFTTLLFRYRPYTIVIFLWAVIMVYSRIYLGVHFLTDIIPGIIIGLLVGWGIYRLYTHIINKKLPYEGNNPYLTVYHDSTKKMITMVLAGNILLLFVFGFILA